MGWFGGGGGGKKDKKASSETGQSDAEVLNDGLEQESVGTAGGNAALSPQAPQQKQQQQLQPVKPSAADVSVFEFGSAQADGDERLTLAGYCPVSDEMEPCRWEVFPAGQTAAPGFRILF